MGKKAEYRELEYGERIKTGDVIMGEFEIPSNGNLVGKKYNAKTPWKIFRRVMTSSEVQAAMGKATRAFLRKKKATPGAGAEASHG